MGPGAAALAALLVGGIDSWVPGVFSGEGSATPFDENFQPKLAYGTIRDTLLLTGRG